MVGVEANVFTNSFEIILGVFFNMGFEQIILFVALAVVAVILGWGVLTMARGGDYNVKNSNRIMRYRIIFQAIALIVILGLMWFRRQGG